MNLSLQVIGLIAASLALPIGWGWFVNWAINCWRARRGAGPPRDSFTDYQI